MASAPAVEAPKSPAATSISSKSKVDALKLFNKGGHTSSMTAYFVRPSSIAMGQDKDGIIWKALELFDDAVSALADEEPDLPPPHRLYHYTSFESMLAITASQTLRASLATDLNDATEVRHGLGIAHDLLAGIMTPGLQSLLSFEGQLASAIGAARVSTSTKGLSAPFVICFCGSAGKSGQWLNYGRAGAGVALGFDPDLGKNLNRRDLPGAPVGGHKIRRIKVEYDPSKQRLLLENALSAASAFVQRYNDLDKLYEAASNDLTSMVQRLAASMKHESFSEEDEYRLLTFFDRNQMSEDRLSKIQFREGGRHAAFETWDFDPDMLKEVIVGHACPASEGAVALWLAQNGYRETTVRRSEVPVRPS